MRIKDLCEAERPREKLISRGVENLSDAELIAILLRTGAGDKNVVELSQKMLSDSGGSLYSLSMLSFDELLFNYGGKGIGKAKAATLEAAFELGRRAAASGEESNEAISSASQIVGRLGPQMGVMDHEECRAVFLNRSNYIVAIETISKGSLESTSVDVRAVVKKALDKKTVTGLILVHNHPSGNPTPGKADMKVTESLKDALSYFDIALYDHIIISRTKYFSFESGKIYKI